MSLLGKGGSPDLAVRVLKKVPLFAGLQDHEYRELVNVCHIAHYTAGSVLFNEGDSGLNMFVLLAGEVEISTHRTGLLHSLQAGEVLGEIAVLRQIRRTASARVAEEATVLYLSRDDLDHLLARSPRTSYLIMRKVAEALAERLMAANNKLGQGRA